MKTKIILSLALTLCFSFYTKAADIPIKLDDNLPKTKSLVMIPVLVDYTLDDLELTFFSDLGIVDVVILDEFNNIVIQNFLNTTVNSIFYISTEYLETGNYKLIIKTASKSYSGSFEKII